MPFNISWTFVTDDPYLLAFYLLVGAALTYLIFDAIKGLFKKKFKNEIVAPPAKQSTNDWRLVKGKITLYGDSIAHGGYVGPHGTPERLSPTPAETLARMTGMIVDDRSFNGNTVRNIYHTFFDDGHDGEITVIQAAINDTAQGYSVRERLFHMITHEIVRGRKVIITGMSWTDRINIPLYERQTKEIKELVERFSTRDVMYAHWDTVLFYGGDLDLMDDIHPSLPYSRRLMNNVSIQVEKLKAS